MGLSSYLADVSGGSIPILLVAAAAGWFASLRALLLCLLHSFGFTRPSPHRDADAGSLASGLASLIVLSEQLASTHRSFAYVREAGVEEAGEDGTEPSCVVCLEAPGEGEVARRLACCRRVFHSECLDGWFDQRRLSCPLCRSELAPEDRRADTERRIGAELVAWLAPTEQYGTSSPPAPTSVPPR